MNDWTSLADALRLGGWVIYPLTLLAVLALAIVLDRAYALWRFARMSESNLAGDVENHAGYARLASIHEALPQRHALRRIGRLFDGRAPLWQIEARLQTAATAIERDMSRGLWLLETIVTAAPLLGLLGTIVGMMHSFRLIGGDGLVNPAGVSGGVAQALIATAIGLVIALLALFAFNYLSRRIDRLMDELESFSNECLGEMRLVEERNADVHLAGQPGSARS
ncbi:MotA/TolQ/ExbB proton channel family protein [Paraburkholderia megapolitana]|uniref:Outer membrane transport energization protein ExbB n=1 Tax=Paraburkholderia megapolitana TaxID=420953 RepID=A0A1I3G3T5_9BURK|nr:MotA/TolQ/ExbB proton channel family protein [Paraburkholderia megapolitana]QDQ82699.1 MotA/TolQ/ExbB proton channel family protein [Paraburkholderia megapolitana]SFI18143.1 outer membrane transport energization protein ExbB [Paraburkholderia megapolitana]